MVTCHVFRELEMIGFSAMYVFLKRVCLIMLFLLSLVRSNIECGLEVVIRWSGVHSLLTLCSVGMFFFASLVPFRLWLNNILPFQKKVTEIIKVVAM